MTIYKSYAHAKRAADARTRNNADYRYIVAAYPGGYRVSNAGFKNN